MQEDGQQEQKKRGSPGSENGSQFTRWFVHCTVLTYNFCCSAIYELEPEIGKAILRGEEPAITSADLHLVQEGKYTRTWQEGSGNPHKKCMRCGFETDEDYNYCPKCGGRI